jgi:hypothetical protein
MNFARVYGGLKDQDRIFTNLYKDGDPFIDGALKRVSSICTCGKDFNINRVTGTGLRTFSPMVRTGSSTRSRNPASEVEEVLVSPPA